MEDFSRSVEMTLREYTVYSPLKVDNSAPLEVVSFEAAKRSVIWYNLATL